SLALRGGSPNLRDGSFGFAFRLSRSLASRVVTFLLQPGLLGRARRPGRTAPLGALGRARQKLGELGPCVLEVPLPIARRLADDENVPFAVEAPRGERAQPSFGVGSEHARSFEIEAKLDLGRYLVDVLPAGPGRTHRREVQLVGGNDENGGDDERV